MQENLYHQDKTAFCQKQLFQSLNGNNITVENYCAAQKRFGCQFSSKLVIDLKQGTAALQKAGDHTHGSVVKDPKKSKSGDWGIAATLRHFVDGKIKERFSSLEIIRALRDANLNPLPSQIQMENYVARRKKDLLDDLHEETLSTFFDWCSTNDWRPTIPNDEMFVCPGAILPEQVHWEEDPQKLRIVVCLTTTALLKNAVSQQDSGLPAFVCLDGTYNLLGNGWPTLVIGTVDWDQKYRTIAVVFTSQEDQPAFTAALHSISSAINMCFPGRKLLAKFTMQDGAPAIDNAVHEVLAPVAAGSCWFHVTQNIKKHKGDFAVASNYDLFRADVDLLHASQSPMSTTMQHSCL